jgi:hypothetical protein
VCHNGATAALATQRRRGVCRNKDKDGDDNDCRRHEQTSSHLLVVVVAAWSSSIARSCWCCFAPKADTHTSLAWASTRIIIIIEQQQQQQQRSNYYRYEENNGCRKRLG